VHSITFNAAMNIALTASNALLGLITVPYVTRVLSVEGYGAVGFAQNAASWFSIFCMFGVPLYGVRECAKVRGDENKLAQVVSELLALLTLFTIGGLTVFAVCILLIPDFQNQAPLMWIFLVNTLISSYGAEWFFQAIEQYRYITIRSVVFKSFSLVAILLFVKSPDDYILYGALLAAGLCGNNILNMFRLRRLVPFSGIRGLNLSRHLRPLLSFLSLNIASSVYLYLDTVILAMLTPNLFQVGQYQVVSKLKSFLIGIIGAIVNVFIPRLSYLIHEPSEYKSLLIKSLQVVFNIAFAIFAYIQVFADLVLVFFSSQKYSQAAFPFRVVAIAILCSSMSIFIGYAILTPRGEERELAISNLIGIPVSLILNLALDSKYGALGASVAIACTEFVVLIVQSYFSRKILHSIANIREFIKIIVAVSAAVLMSSICRMFMESVGSILTLMVASLVFFATWVGCLLLMRESFSVSLLVKARRRYRLGRGNES
jgi:O-antigen/teichoic acid export membrane protein